MSSLKEPNLLYFAYGSNMSKSQLTRRCPSAKKLSLAYLDGYEFVFNRRGSHRPGGVASIVETNHPGSRVYGVVWELSQPDILILDQIEDPKAYKRIDVEVHSLEGQRYSCQSYIAYPEAAHIPPNSDYFAIVYGAAKELGLPQTYLDHIASLQF